MEPLDFLDGQEPEAFDAPVADANEPSGPARGPDGKFVAASPAPETDTQPAPVAEVTPDAEHQPQTPPPGYVPISVVQELRAEMKALKQPAPAQPQPLPDLYADPEGYVGQVQQQLQGQMVQQRVTFSRQLAELRHGPEVANKVHEWAVARCDADPAFNQQMLTAPDPYEAAAQAWKREEVLSKLQPADVDKLLGLLANQQPAPAPAPAPQQAPPPRSLASMPSAGSSKPGEQPVGPGVAFDAVFTR